MHSLFVGHQKVNKNSSFSVPPVNNTAIPTNFGQNHLQNSMNPWLSSMNAAALNANPALIQQLHQFPWLLPYLSNLHAAAAATAAAALAAAANDPIQRQQQLNGLQNLYQHEKHGSNLVGIPTPVITSPAIAKLQATAANGQLNANTTLATDLRWQQNLFSTGIPTSGISALDPANVRRRSEPVVPTMTFGNAHGNLNSNKKRSREGKISSDVVIGN